LHLKYKNFIHRCNYGGRTGKKYDYRGLREWGHGNRWLRDTCPDGQDTVKALLDQLEIPYRSGT
jgi:hypothetical protein